jgi:putative transposase
MIEAAEELGKKVGVSQACRALGVPRSSLYRARQPKPATSPRPTPSRALGAEEREAVRAVLNSERFWDSAPREVYATLLDEEQYLCHWRTMYRILEAHDEVRERRQQRRHPVSPKPKLRATGPNEVWTWDITLLRGVRGLFYYLYVVLDLFSRYVVGWMVAERELAKLAEQLIAETCEKQGIRRNQLTLHADRGSAMRSKTVAELLVRLGVTKSHSRPYTPTDNPYSESQFKTMKYRPDYPEQFEGMEGACCWARDFFQWYNHEHYHTSLGLMTPAAVHYGVAEKVYEKRCRVLAAAYAAHPERFVRGEPRPSRWPTEVWINPSQKDHKITDLVGPAASGMQPGAQAGSRGPAGQAQRSLDAAEHLATMERLPDQPDDKGVLLPKFERMLSQSC